MARVPPNYVPAYRLHKSSGQGIVTLSGKDFLLGPFASPASHAKYHQLVGRWLGGGRKPLDPVTPVVGDPSPARVLTVDELIDAHDRHAHAYYVDAAGDPTTEVRNFAAATAPLRELFGPTPADAFSPSKLKAVRSRMIAKGWARTHINKHVNRIRSLWTWATEEELVGPAVYQSLRAVKGLKRGRSKARETEEVRSVPIAHVDAVRPFVSSPVWALIELQRMTGARGGELFKLRAIDIDTTGDVWTFTPVAHKTAHFGHRRTIYFGPRSKAVLRPFMAGRPVDAYLFSPREGLAERAAARATKGKARRPAQRPNARKTTRTLGEHYDRESYRRAIARACKLAKADGASVEHWHPHQLRHTAAKGWRKKYGPDAALVLLGDKTTRMIDVYAEKDQETAMRIAASDA